MTLTDLQQWLGHKHAASTRHYAKILKRTLSAAHKKDDYFARNVCTIQVLIDRDSILTGAAADGQPRKYYDLGDGYCTYDFFAKCEHRLACARCPFYKPKDSSTGQVLAVKDGIHKMLETVDLTDDGRDALEGDRDAITALAERLANTPTPAGPTPTELGTADTFVPLTNLLSTLAATRTQPSWRTGRAGWTPGWCSPPLTAGRCTRRGCPTSSPCWPGRRTCRRCGCTACGTGPPAWRWPPTRI